MSEIVMLSGMQESRTGTGGTGGVQGPGMTGAIFMKVRGARPTTHRIGHR